MNLVKKQALTTVIGQSIGVLIVCAAIVGVWKYALSDAPWWAQLTIAFFMTAVLVAFALGEGGMVADWYRNMYRTHAIRILYHEGKQSYYVQVKRTPFSSWKGLYSSYKIRHWGDPEYLEFSRLSDSPEGTLLSSKEKALALQDAYFEWEAKQYNKELYDLQIEQSKTPVISEKRVSYLTERNN